MQEPFFKEGRWLDADAKDIVADLSDEDLRAELARREETRKLAQIPPLKTKAFDWSEVEGLAKEQMRHLALIGSNFPSAYGNYYDGKKSNFAAELARAVCITMYGQEGWDWWMKK